MDIYNHLNTPIDDFYHWEKTTPNNLFLRQPYGKIWKTWTYYEAGQEARQLLTALQNIGLKKGDHIGILSKNCYQWIITDLAIMMGGFISVPFYASLPKNQLEEVIQKSDIKLLFIGKLETWGDKQEALPTDLPIIRFAHYEGNAKIDIGYHWDDLLKQNQAATHTLSPHLDDIWTILFTSGTTGSPKGVIHTFRNPALVISIERKTNFLGLFKTKNHRYLSFLPLNHVGERIGIEINCLATGGTISFGESLQSFPYNLQNTQPTVFFAVPRIWTKFYQGVTARLKPSLLSILFKTPFINTIIKNKIKTGLGLREARVVATGAAMTPEYLKNWYKELGIHLIEAYGMTEVCGSITNGAKNTTPANSVGEVVPFCEIKIDPDTQEILMKAPYTMIGYYKDPEKTAEVLRDGWIHSGDRGTMDKDGFLRVIGRVKDAFKTAKGQYIIPNPIEELLSTNEYIEQVCVVGMAIPQPIALINLSEPAKQTAKEEIEQSFLELLTTINQQLAPYQKISTIIINKDTWSEQNQLLTPTLKVRRNNIDDTYCDKYLYWHELDSKIIWE